MPNFPIPIPEQEFVWTYARSGGPGGQNVNKVASKATLRWNVRTTNALIGAMRERFLKLVITRTTNEGELVLVSQRYRDQERNREDCLEKLAELLTQAATPPTPRFATKPTKASKRRRLAAKQHTSSVKAGRRAPRMDD
ncbi:alternative ribosome rescue aminoacyl-tRNA hydrolase ArfB [Tuwongella immobilis]|uniref:Prokaryotic-type class I peptide chain release factors domain-containing protein n=1 Tax=Tuwongella immobilis TaxID=692036 RepID=A0A6C2YSK2_9BACT|nr:alternative ribosome rescue aminoacyl-tRNA hydrolase ArfB [Tuwongella immobilis]VIP04436.1 peptide chain release factor i : Peptidyl-tRNA hydrolase domain protein OS=Rhodopirellula maiorica SM1 GN=RMSM_05281 PE=4 SV=1: RF-1 [Tuwongella immobilis]VTS06234.1 peptide chain release factor i : Peptidyl-tRNA hydrolase domain protein OS=Rhodopirellula maiorica SM1 GN=RMSM_05281 PE=4 SV=1: RF-1 [Tuwongella immobilis]